MTLPQQRHCEYRHACLLASLFTNSIPCSRPHPTLVCLAAVEFFLSPRPTMVIALTFTMYTVVHCLEATTLIDYQIIGARCALTWTQARPSGCRNHGVKRRATCQVSFQDSSRPPHSDHLLHQLAAPGPEEPVAVPLDSIAVARLRLAWLERRPQSKSSAGRPAATSTQPNLGSVTVYAPTSHSSYIT